MVGRYCLPFFLPYLYPSFAYDKHSHKPNGIFNPAPTYQAVEVYKTNVDLDGYTNLVRSLHAIVIAGTDDPGGNGRPPNEPLAIASSRYRQPVIRVQKQRPRATKYPLEMCRSPFIPPCSPCSCLLPGHRLPLQQRMPFRSI